MTLGRVFLGGHSYGGRQATMLAASVPDVASALLLLAYPLHPPARPAQPRTAHFPSIKTPALFVHGTTDPFGSADALAAALSRIPAETRLVTIDGAGHDLGRSRRAARPGADLVATVVAEFVSFVGGSARETR
jgi:predicted alpha/beta-hydrolase family hydrolase